MGAVYVLGMVTPLLVMSMFLSGKVEKLKILKNKITTLKLFGKEYFVTVSNFIAFLIFLIAGVFTLVLTLRGQLSMAKSERFARIIQDAGESVNSYVGDSLFVNILFVLFIFVLIFVIASKLKRGGD